MSKFKYRVFPVLLVLTIAGGCSSETPGDSAPAANPEAAGGGPSSKVIAALEAAVRGEEFADNLHPETEKTGKAMSPTQAAFDVRHYALELKVMPDSRSIEGTLAVTFEALAATDAIELDLDPDLAIRAATMDGQALTVTRDEDSFTVALPEELAEGDRGTVTVAYGGKPHVALAPPWFGGFVWAESNGSPWFATAVQTEGCDLWWPCKDTYADKPDEGVVVSISAPRGTVVASVGVLEEMVEGEDGYDTWRWVSRHPYAGYAIAINGGPYEVIEAEYTGVNGTTYPIRFWALPENVDKATKLVETDVIPDLEFFERMLGPYPWGDEKVGFVETPHLGMEHQTINGYGEQYKRGKHGFDGLLHHELAHEWFGNVMTHRGPEDSWLHEGYGAYMQHVYSEETIGGVGYFDLLYGAYVQNSHCAPVANADAKDIGEAFDNRDIYTKGAWMLHTLRNYIGEDAFWAGTRRLLYDTAEPWDLPYPIQFRYRSTDEFIEIMSEEAGEDVSWLVETYLREVGMPELKQEREDGRLTLSWEVPGGRPFPMPVEVSVNGVVSEVRITSDSGSIRAPAMARVIVDPDSKIMRALPIIGDCEEQSEMHVDRRIERYTRMAEEYGWTRD